MDITITETKNSLGGFSPIITVVGGNAEEVAAAYKQVNEALKRKED